MGMECTTRQQRVVLVRKSPMADYRYICSEKACLV